MEKFTINQFRAWARRNRIEMIQPSSVNRKHYVELEKIEILTPADLEEPEEKTFDNPNQQNLF